MDNQITTKNFYTVMIRLAFLTLIVVWSLMILFPFTSILLWAVILSLALSPLHQSLARAIGGRPKMASAIIVLSGLLIILIPGWLFLDSIISSAMALKNSFDAGTLTIPPPSDDVKTWPLVGNKLFLIWSNASVNLEQSVIDNKEEVILYGSKLIKGIMSVTSGGLQLIVSFIIAGFLLVVSGAGDFARKFFTKIAGGKGDEFADLAYKTIGNVVKGILGVAFIQAVLVGIGFVFAGVPYAGLWTLIVLMLGILQIPPGLVVFPIIAYLFTTLNTMPAIIWSVYLLIAGLSDNVLKPLLLGKGAPVPMLVIFLGVIGGFMFSGFIGLFTGAIVVSLGYKLFVAWVLDANPES